MGTRLIDDRKARALALRELRKVLASLREMTAAPPSDVITYPEAVPWDAPPHPTPAADMAALAEAMQAGSPLALPEAATVQYAGPTPALMQLVHRLVDLLGLSDLEREFFAAGAAREVPDAWDGLAAYADWLEDRGNEDGAARVRKLTPQDGDVLVFTAPRGEYPQDGSFDLARRVKEALAARGVEVSWVLLPHGSYLDCLSAAQMAGLGWVPAGRVAEEREACAGLAERGGCVVTADRIRARGGNVP